MRKILLVMSAAVLLAACDDPKAARKALGNLGFTNVETKGYSWFGCGKDDSFSTAFEATNAQGQRVTGVVCSGWFKGATVRFD